MRDIEKDKEFIAYFEDAILCVLGGKYRYIATYWIGQFENAQKRIRELESYNGRVEKIRGYGE